MNVSRSSQALRTKSESRSLNSLLILNLLNRKKANRKKKKAEGKEDELFVTNSICKRVDSRSKTLLEFADTVDVVLFVSGKHSSNGIYLYQLCKNHKQDTFFISSKEDICLEKLKGFETIGISGATSTPMWLMEEIRDYVLEASENNKL